MCRCRLYRWVCQTYVWHNYIVSTILHLQCWDICGTLSIYKSMQGCHIFLQMLQVHWNMSAFYVLFVHKVNICINFNHPICTIWHGTLSIKYCIACVCLYENSGLHLGGRKMRWRDSESHFCSCSSAFYSMRSVCCGIGRVPVLAYWQYVRWYAVIIPQ